MKFGHSKADDIENNKKKRTKNYNGSNQQCSAYNLNFKLVWTQYQISDKKTQELKQNSETKKIKKTLYLFVHLFHFPLPIVLSIFFVFVQF